VVSSDQSIRFARKNIETIFIAIQDWQVQHSELEIVDVDYLYMQNTYSSKTENYTYGISLLTKQK
jgi:hypothetical protein